jgi:C4-dicarboxylate-specific signal transduction histidine kinase
LVHEVRNKTTVVSAYLEQLAKLPAFSELSEKNRERHERAAGAVSALDRLAETFLPLASRSFGRGKRVSILEDRITGALALLEQQLRQAGIEVRVKATGSTPVAIDPAELDTVLLNLFDNAIYWLSQAAKGQRILEIQVRRHKGSDRVKIGVHDSGPGVSVEDAEKIFWPGVTKKPGGIGMGLTIAAEIVDAYDGKMALEEGPGLHGGASFQFELPIKQT